MIFGSPEGKSPGRTTWAFWLRENGKVSLTAMLVENMKPKKLRDVIGACESREAHSHKRPHERSAFDFTYSGSLAMGIQKGEVFSEVGFSVVFCS